MNFPGLDPVWSGFHRALHRLGVRPTWSLEACRAALDRGEKVLVVATTALGDSLLTTPLIETLSRRLGRERVSLLVKAPYADLYRDDPRLHRVFTVRGKYRWDGLIARLQADPHRLALLANFTEPDLLPALARGGVRGFLRYRSRWTHYPRWIANRDMLCEPGHEDYATGHAIENNLAMAQALGLDPVTHRLALPHLTGGARTRRILLHPGASRSNKIWAARNWAAVADALIEKFDLDLVLTGSAEERELAESVRRELRFPERAAVVAGTLSLRELARLQAESTAFLSGDTGPYHLAVAVGCPTLTLFAPTDRGSSSEACGPHQADPGRHRIMETARPGDSIATLPPERVTEAACALVAELLANAEAAP
jgi:ADP-heptose:LPS heptosyltransferase